MLTDFDGNIGLNEAEKTPCDSEVLRLEMVGVSSDDVFRRIHCHHVVPMKDSRHDEERIDGVSPMGEETDVEKRHLEDKFDEL